MWEHPFYAEYTTVEKILWGTGVVAGTLGSGSMFLSITGFFGAVALMFKTFFLGLVAGGVFSLIYRYRVRARESLSIAAVMVATAGLLIITGFHHKPHTHQRTARRECRGGVQQAPSQIQWTGQSRRLSQLDSRRICPRFRAGYALYCRHVFGRQRRASPARPQMSVGQPHTLAC